MPAAKSTFDFSKFNFDFEGKKPLRSGKDMVIIGQARYYVVTGCGCHGLSFSLF
jgi:hypothetical protein